MTSRIRWLEPIREVMSPERFGSDHPMRVVTAEIGDGRGWSDERAGFVAGVFDTLSEGWHADHSSDVRLASLEDALDRGALDGVTDSSHIVEVGCGTGAATERVAARCRVSAALDLAPQMLAKTDRRVAPFVRGDAASLPLATGAADVIVLVNMFLFADEYARVLAPEGCIVWISTMGDETPIYIPPEDVVAALPGEWETTGSYAGTGLWLVARRSSAAG